MKDFFEEVTGCYISEDGERYALYDSEEDLLCYVASRRFDFGPELKYVRDFARYYEKTKVGWRPCSNSCPLPDISICAQCNNSHRRIDYLCPSCRG